MKRYIEIVYDNSGSMNEKIKNKYKYEVAQELFEQVLLPIIGLPGDEIVLRLLGHQCHLDTSIGTSLTNLYGTDKQGMLQHIKSIYHNGHTPLIHTICDSINACKSAKFDQHCIFVLTDGDDTCSVNIYDLISKEDLEKYVKYFQVLMAQLAVKSKTSRNNLKAISEGIGGVTVLLDDHDDPAIMKEKLKKALSISGINNQFPLEYCFEQLPGPDLTWDDIPNLGIIYTQAYSLFKKKFLSWKPDFNKNVSQLQFAELKFLFALRDKTGLTDILIETMLSQLKKPYYYSHDCIYWDFLNARWKYFKKANKIEQVDNPDAHIADGNEEIDSIKKHYDLKLQSFDDYNVYKVELTNTSNTSFNLIPKGNTDYNKIIRPGDLLKFKK